MVDRTYLGGDFDQAASWAPAGVPGDGDRIQTAGLPLTINANATIGVDDGTAPIDNSVQFPAGQKAGAVFVSPGVTVTLRGRVSNSNGDLQVPPGAQVNFTNSDDQILDFGDFDNSAGEAPTLVLGGVLDYTGTGGSMRITVNGGGAVIADGGIINRFGNGTSALDVQLGSDPAQCFCARPLYFTQSRGELNVKCWGDGTMGDIEVTGLYNINPQTNGDIKFDGNDDAVAHGSANVRRADNIRAEGDLQLRYMQDYGSTADLRITGTPLTVAGDADAGNCRNWLIGNHNGSFMRAIGALTNGYFRDTADNPHAISLARLKSQFPVFSGNVFDLKGAQGSSDTGDCYATDAASAATDFLVAGQEITITDDLVLPTGRTGQSDGPIFVTLNGLLAVGVHVGNLVKLRLLNNTGLFSNGGHVLNVDEHSTVGASQTDTVIEHKRNIWSNHDAQSPMAIALMLRGFTGANDDVITLAQSDENVFHLYPDGLGIQQSATGINDLTTSTEAPDFGDATRNLEEWGARCHGLTEDEAIINLVRAGFPGYGTTAAVDAADFDVEAMRQWVRAGYVDRNPAHAGRGITDTAPLEMTDPMPLVDGEDETLVFNGPVTVTEAFLYDPDTKERTLVTLNTKPGPASELITSVQGDIPHGRELLLGVKLS